ncbi:nucleotidyltransferase [Fervidicella metallireducens AeB]|uniref:Nucleotidyltransferase n=1 Tax=Fervidicella metallireducens AeB TaxID=1403537 RepID=A0A017S055_9CLOT|nr:nucleotidyltransferase domain-containing protein [Fervidicella metallireducens]EYE89530.1 nucleotidyltransferase [Fervidicella metallireducens AeB]
MIKFGKVDFSKIINNFPKLKNVFSSYGDKIIVAYLFGSCHTKKITPLSDIDFAVLFDYSLTKEEMQKLEQEIFLKITDVLKTDEIDFVILNNAPLSMKYGVIKNKEIIYYSNKLKVVDFESSIVTRYLDFKPIRDEINNEFLRKMIGG